MTAAPAAVCIGLATLDAIVRTSLPLPRGGRRVANDGDMAGGGVSATAAVALARLGAPVSYIGVVGDDLAGGMIRDGLAAEGIDLARLRRVSGRSPVSVIVVDEENGERTILHRPGEGELELAELDLDLCRGAGWLHLDHVGHPILPALRAAGVRTSVSLDAGNPIPGLRLDLVDLYGPTEEALAAAYPGSSPADAIRRVIDQGPRLVAVTRGAHGSLAGERLDDGSVRVLSAAPLQVEVESTLGAGDVFHGALLAALLRGLDLEGALPIANAAAALSCRSLDARSAIPDWREVESAADGIAVDKAS